jgi:hypothetical protein
MIPRVEAFDIELIARECGSITGLRYPLPTLHEHVTTPWARLASTSDFDTASVTVWPTELPDHAWAWSTSDVENLNGCVFLEPIHIELNADSRTLDASERRKRVQAPVLIDPRGSAL